MKIPDGPDVVSTTIDVTLKTLDQVASEIDLISLDLVKLDIQGSELMFLAGGQETLRRLRPAILLEVSPVKLACIPRRSCDLIAAVESLGYRVHLLQENGEAGPVLRSWDVGPTVAASNVVCVPDSRPDRMAMPLAPWLAPVRAPKARPVGHGHG